MGNVQFIAVNNQTDINAVATLAYEIWREHYASIISHEQIEYMLDKFQSPLAIAGQIASGYSYYFIRQAQGKNVGYFALVPKPAELFLSKIYVARRHRNQGCAKAAIVFIEEIARSKKLAKVTLTVNKNNTGSIAAYKKMGFVIANAVIGDIGNSFVMDDFQMEKPVAFSA